ncbi:MAG: thiamine phosphate synthase [Campylobacterales bacterium]|nr:thiamine phosphate synthase [Campylobacterales bacterium]
MIVYRDRSNPNYSDNAKLFLKAAKYFDFNKILLHGDVELAYRLKADGVHLRSDQFDLITEAKSRELFVVASAHSLKDLLDLQKRGADMATLSPIFATPNKGKPLGVDILKALKAELSMPVIALGGILKDEQIQVCEGAGFAGFASIRYFTR